MFSKPTDSIGTIVAGVVVSSVIGLFAAGAMFSKAVEDECANSTGSGEGVAYVAMSDQVYEVDLNTVMVHVLPNNTANRKERTEDLWSYGFHTLTREVSPRNETYANSQVVVAISFALTRQGGQFPNGNRYGMCPYRQTNCKYGYNPETNMVTIRNSSADQNSEPWEHQWPSAVERATEWAEHVRNAVLTYYDERYDKNVVLYADYINVDQNGWFDLSQKGYTVDETLEAWYGKKYSSLKDIHIEYTGGQTNANTSKKCANKNKQPGNSIEQCLQKKIEPTKGSDLSLLTKPIGTMLQQNGSSLEKFNADLKSKIDCAGYQTANGVVTAGVALMQQLAQYGYKLRYILGGGHWNDDQYGPALATFGDTTTGRLSGLDCSGFIAWSMHNAGYKVDRYFLASTFYNRKGAKKVELDGTAQLKPGDLLESSAHVIMVVGVDTEKNEYIIAQESSSALGGFISRVSFSEMKKRGTYWGVDMSEYYKDSSHFR